METRSEADWREARTRHRDRLRPYADRHRGRRSRGRKHPVEDFLWQYYSLRPGRLLAWSPGVGVGLRGAGAGEFPDDAGYVSVHGEARILPFEAIPTTRVGSMTWIRTLLANTAATQPFFGCLGLHEWAMVYEPGDIRHPQLPLRLTHVETRAVVESLPVSCSHFDAFRFFSASARPLNRLQPTAEGRLVQEQPACLHANMDLFKWCMKLSPWIPAELTADAFELALGAREIDMRASPYDVRDLGHEPICIETPEGRQQYVREQKRIADASVGIRSRMVAELDRILSVRGVAA